MINRLRRRLLIEYSHYQQLGPNMKRMLWEWALIVFAWPMVGLFVNAYLWQQGEGVSRLVIYNAMFFVGLPIGFAVNKALLKVMHVLRVYFLGTILQGLSAFLVVLLPGTTLTNLGILGLAFGIGAGLYWANKSYLSLRLTRGKNRLYYYSIEKLIDLLISIIVPFVVGWILVGGELNGWYSKEAAYRGLMFVGMMLIILSGWVVQGITIKDFEVKSLLIKKLSPGWKVARTYNLLSYMWDGLQFFLPSLLVLVYLGDEAVLGTMEAVTSIISALTIYVIGRKATLDKGWKVVLIGDLLMLAGVVALIMADGAVGVVAFLILSDFGALLSYGASWPMNMEMMDLQKEASNPENQYIYIFDAEVSFDIARLLGVFVFVGLIYVFGLDLAIKGSLVVVGLIRLGSVYYAREMSRILAGR